MSLVTRYRFLEKFFTFKEGKFRATYRTPQNIPSIRLQYRYFKTKFTRDVLLFQVGRYYQFYQKNGADLQLLGLRKINTSSDRKAKFGFPIRLENVYIRKLKEHGRSVTVVGEGDKYLTSVKERVPRYRFGSGAVINL